MGWGNGVVDWGMTVAPMPIDPACGDRAYGKAYDKAAEKVYLKSISNLSGKLKGWRQLAIDVQHSEDNTGVGMYTWREVARNLRDQYAPHLTNDQILKKYDELEPQCNKRWYNKHIKDRTWDK